MACGATGCPRCEQLPDVSVTDWGIHIWPPLGHSAGKVREALSGLRQLSVRLEPQGSKIIYVGD